MGLIGVPLARTLEDVSVLVGKVAAFGFPANLCTN